MRAGIGIIKARQKGARGELVRFIATGPDGVAFAPLPGSSRLDYRKQSNLFLRDPADPYLGQEAVAELPPDLVVRRLVALALPHVGVDVGVHLVDGFLRQGIEAAPFRQAVPHQLVEPLAFRLVGGLADDGVVLGDVLPRAGLHPGEVVAVGPAHEGPAPPLSLGEVVEGLGPVAERPRRAAVAHPGDPFAARGVHARLADGVVLDLPRDRGLAEPGPRGNLGYPHLAVDAGLDAHPVLGVEPPPLLILHMGTFPPGEGGMDIIWDWSALIHGMRVAMALSPNDGKRFD